MGAPDLTKPGFSLEHARFFAELSLLSYKSLPVVRQEAKNKYGYDTFVPFPLYDAEAFVLINDATILITFRGTVTQSDWFTDFNFPYVKGPWGKVHQGFDKYLNYNWEKLLKIVTNLYNKNVTVWLAGHSLGGALAMLSAAYFLKEGIKASGIYTFGQPRVGNNEFANIFYKSFPDRYHRFVNHQDVVPNVPPYTLADGYRHAGNKCYFFDEKGNFHKDYAFWETMSGLYNTLFKAVSPGGMAGWSAELAMKSPEAFEDHGMENYLRFVKAA